MFVPAWPVLRPTHLLSRPRHAAPLPFPLRAPARTAFYVARYAIYHLFRALGVQDGGEVLVPVYHHGNEVRAIRAAGARPLFYSIGLDLMPDLDELETLLRRRPRALFVIHYLGWPQPIRALLELARRYEVPLVEDCALALFSEHEGRPLGGFSDYAVFCLYKTLPLPHGGLLVQNRARLQQIERLELRPCDPLSLAARCAELALGDLRSRAERLGRALQAAKRGAGMALSAAGLRRAPVGDAGFRAADADLGMAELCWTILERCDASAVRAARRRNFQALLERLSGRAQPLLTDLPQGVCPLFFPLVVRDKETAVRELLATGVEAVPFWNRGDGQAEPGPGSAVRFLREHVIEVPIHQDVTPEQVDYMAERIARLGACAPLEPART